MILVIPYRDDGNNGRELRHCIRSMVKHGPITGVCIIGQKPEWYTGEFISAKDIPGRKEWSIVSKIVLSPHPTFLLSSDDCFARADFDSTLPLYYSGSLRNTQRFGRYQDRLDNTQRLYPDGNFYDIHTPMMIDLLRFQLAHSLCDWGNKEYLCKSVYANSVGGGVQLQDCKIRSGHTVSDLPFFSTSDRNAKFIKLEEMYPVPSPYEST